MFCLVDELGAWSLFCFLLGKDESESEYVSEKESLVSGTVDHLNKTGGFESAKANPLDTMKTFTEKDLSLLNRHHRNKSVAGNEIEARLGSSIADFNVKPKLLESKISTRQDFAMLSDGFKKIFSQDKKD